METNKPDEELVKAIEDAIDSSTSSIAALDKVIAWEKEHRGLKGFHVSAPLDVMCGIRKVDDVNAEAERMAHDVLLVHLARAKGQLKEVDISEEGL